MREIELDLTGAWDVVIEKKQERIKKVSEKKIPKTKVLEEGGIYLPASIISSMEILAQGVFRPNEEDIEVVYALSGMDRIWFINFQRRWWLANQARWEWGPSYRIC